MHFSNNIQNFYHIKYDVGKEEKTKKMKERRTEKKVNYGHKISFCYQYYVPRIIFSSN